MRVSREQVGENRRKILEAAGRLFRERGFEAVTVVDVMKAANLTHGGFYGYFASKEDLIAKAIDGVLTAAAAPSDLSAFAEQYLSAPHRDDLAGGCPMAALASETARQSGGARAGMTAGLRAQIDRLTQVAPGVDAARQRQTAVGSWSAMVGAVILARMSDDPELSDAILNGTREWLASQAAG